MNKIILTFPTVDAVAAMLVGGGSLLERRRAALEAAAADLLRIRPDTREGFRTFLGGLPSLRPAPDTPRRVLDLFGSIELDPWIPVPALRSMLAGLPVLVWGGAPLVSKEEPPPEQEGVTPDWHLTSTNARAAGADPTDIHVGLLDTTMPPQWQTRLPVAAYQDFTPRCSVDRGYSMHSCAAGTLVADRARGVAPGARLVVAGVTEVQRDHTVAGSVADVLHGLQWLLRWEKGNQRVKVINISLDLGVHERHGFRAALRLAERWRPLPVIVAGAGNRGTRDVERLGVPAVLPEVIAVGATQADGQVWAHSGWADNKPDLVAPGAGVVTVDQQGAFTARAGTSFAAPIVAGVAARLCAAGVPAHEVGGYICTHYVEKIPGEHRDGHGRLRVPDQN